MTSEPTSPRLVVFARRVYALLIVVAAVATPVALGSCAKSPTVILVEISADDTAPPVLLLRTTVARGSDPSQLATNLFGSLSRGDAADRPAPYLFPMLLPINVPPDWSGAVTILVEGRDWNTYAVNATGTTSVDLVPEHQNQAMLTLTGVGGGGDTDGGTGGDRGDDGSRDTVDDDTAIDTAIDTDAATE